ncbi:hypothetical protein [uncultured Sphingomonas sp.]|uniref:hypothetical protein n=1 Tax=uncultured Sphingomonas sp. TaxID=158754 RepID=UPI0035C95890
MSDAPAYAALKAHRTRIHNLEHLQALGSWDRMTKMPPGGAKARAAAQGELAALLQRMASDPSLDALLADAASETLAPDDAANLALMARERALAQAQTEGLVQRRAELVRAASHAWSEAKDQDSWAVFAPALGDLLDAVREEAARIGDRLGLSPYDALLDRHDRGLRHARVTALFDSVAGWLPELTARIVARQASETVIEPAGPFDLDRQHALCVAAMTLLGFDFAGGRLDTSHHPFTGGVPEDVRLTTRYRADAFLPALLGVVHETGHGLYQAGLPRAWAGQPLGEPCSAAMHEAQALSFERQLARTPAFAARLAPLLRDAFGDQSAFAPDNLLGLMTRVRPGPVRVDADEVTYPAHILLRTEIEAALIDGGLAVADVPARWDEGMARLLGVDTCGRHRDGALQDIHWSQGMFGYFPSYLIGAAIAAQLAARFRAEHPGVETDPARLGDYAAWLAPNVWHRGAALTTEALVAEVTGERLSDAALRAHLEQRYLG